MSERIATRRIRFGFSENPRLAHCTFDTWHAAEAAIVAARADLPSDYLGYDKTDFAIEYVDDTEYQGRYDLSPGITNESLHDHVYYTQALAADLWHPHFWSLEQYTQYRTQMAIHAPDAIQYARDFLAQYTLEDPNPYAVIPVD